MKKTRWTSENKVFKILLGRKSWLCFLKILYILFSHLINYRKVTFGFSSKCIMKEFKYFYFPV